MPRYYCDYCDTYLTHDSPSVRKQHNAGYKHKANVRSYYQQYEAQLNQSLIDQKVKEHLGAFRPPVASYARPGLPVLPTPLPGQFPSFRPPVLSRPMPPGHPGYAPMPPHMVAPPGAPLPGQMNGAPLPGQMNGLQRPPSALPPPPPLVPGSGGMPTSVSGAPQMFPPPPPYQVNMPLPTSGGSEGSAPPSAPPPEANQ